MLCVILIATLAMPGCSGFFVSENAINSITLSPGSVLLKTGESISISATAFTVGGKMSDVSSQATWTTNDGSIATVDGTGKVTAGSNGGTTTVKAKDGGESATANVVVSTGAIPTVMNVNGNTQLVVGSKYQYTAVAALNGQVSFDLTPFVTWISSNSSVATVSSTGLVTAIATCGGFSGTSCPTITASIATSTSTLSNNVSILAIQ
jgi:hypothetical protein